MSSSDEEMKPRVRSLFMSRLEMAEALQSQVTLGASEALVPFFLPMAREALEGRTEVIGKTGREDEQ